MGWSVSAVNDRHLTLKALDQALRRRGPAPGLLHHSDQGCTYDSADYQRVLEARGLVCSYFEVFYNQQRRHSTIGRISSAALERRFSAQAA